MEKEERNGIWTSAATITATSVLKRGILIGQESTITFTIPNWPRLIYSWEILAHLNEGCFYFSFKLNIHPLNTHFGANRRISRSVEWRGLLTDIQAMTCKTLAGNYSLSDMHRWNLCPSVCLDTCKWIKPYPRQKICIQWSIHYAPF